MERRLNVFSALFVDWCRAEQSRLLEQIRWLETGSRHVGARTGGGTWIDVTDGELARLKLNFDRLEQILSVHEREVAA